MTMKAPLAVAILLAWVLAFSPVAAAPGASVKDFGKNEPLVATYYFYWYDSASGEHFRNADGSDALTDHPLAKSGYSYKSAATHRKELEDMMEAGIDVMLPVYWGSPDGVPALPGMTFSNEGLGPLVVAQEQLRAAGKRPPQVGMFYDTTTLRENSAARHVSLETTVGRDWFYQTIRAFFSRIPRPMWATIEGRPLIFLYIAGFASGGTQNPYLLEDMGKRFVHDFGGAPPYVVVETSWKIPADSTYGWGGAFGLQVLGVAALGPGYDDHAVPGRQSPRKPRENGAFYRRNWESLLQRPRAARPTIAVIETWNEYHEGSEIAESVEYGRQYIPMTRQFTDRWRRGEELATP